MKLRKLFCIIIKFSLPWIATIITSLPYNDRTSRFLDRLQVLSEVE